MIRRHPLLLILFGFLLLLAGCGGTSPSASPSTSAGECSYPSDGASPARAVDPPPANPDPTAPTEVVISTNRGDIPVTLEPKQAPCAVNSFLSLAGQGYYDDTRCHRLSTQSYYILQCGDPTGSGIGSPGYSFADELVPNDPRLQPCVTQNQQQYCTYNTGTVAMANPGPNHNGSQFFFVYGNSLFPPNYTVLGHFDAAGLKVLKKIAALGVGKANGMGGAGDGAPAKPVIITGVR